MFPDAHHTAWPGSPRAAPQMLEIEDLVGRLGDVIGAFSARVWTRTTALQHARGLVATPFILCGVTLGANLSAPCTLFYTLFLLKGHTSGAHLNNALYRNFVNVMPSLAPISVRALCPKGAHQPSAPY